MFGVGTKVEARFGGADHWFPGVIEAISGDSYSIHYDDGDNEANVPAALVRPIAAPAVASTPAKPPGGVSGGGFAVGTKVEARFAKGSVWFPGTITGATDAGYDILYDDGDKESGVDASIVRPRAVAPVGDPSGRGLDLSVGSKVFARFFGGDAWFLATIEGGSSSAGWDLLYHDGDKERAVKETSMRAAPVMQSAALRLEACPWRH